MPRIFIYGEDGLTLKYTKERLGEILHKLGDNSNPVDCTDIITNAKTAKD